MNLANAAAVKDSIESAVHIWDTSIHYCGKYKVRWICKSKYAKAKNIDNDYDKIIKL